MVQRLKDVRRGVFKVAVLALEKVLRQFVEQVWVLDLYHGVLLGEKHRQVCVKAVVEDFVRRGLRSTTGLLLLRRQ